MTRFTHIIFACLCVTFLFFIILLPTKAQVTDVSAATPIPYRVDDFYYHTGATHWLEMDMKTLVRGDLVFMKTNGSCRKIVINDDNTITTASTTCPL